jgi:DNA-binding NarL/FixJ family response regulator
MTQILDRQIKVLIVDDHPIVRTAIRSLLRSAADIQVVDEGANGQQAIDLAKRERPDLILLDIELPDLRGDAVLRKIRELKLDTRVLAVTSYSDREYLLSMLENGASGYITKDEVPAKLLEAIRTIVYAGRSWFSPQVIKSGRSAPPEEQTLTELEIKILRQLIRGRSQTEIARALELQEARVAKFLGILMMKYDVDSLAALKYIAERVLGAA